MKIQLNMPLRGYNKGKILDFSNPDVKYDKYWDRRIKDSKIDNCVTVINDPVKSDDKVNQAVKPIKKMRAKNVD